MNEACPLTPARERQRWPELVGALMDDREVAFLGVPSVEDESPERGEKNEKDVTGSIGSGFRISCAGPG